MTSEHVTEQELQDYAYLGITDEKNWAHLSTCTFCKAQISAYQSLYRQIQQTETPQIDLETELFILDRLPEYSRTDKKENWYFYGSLVTAVTLITGTTIALWGTLRWAFTGITLLAIAAALVLATGVLFMQLAAILNTYRKRLKAIGE
ncbi:hypothetical protein [Parapedobacter sp. DT-150]|uniref:hypothetical protein n=1 Tax=Parapedobacter sp. DT-150 TaxID=3396162 RepID=UPI003F1D674E